MNNEAGVAEKKKPGRPRKVTNANEDPKLVKKRMYMRKYTGDIKKDILELSQMEIDCDEELKLIRKEKKMLLDELEKSNKQASSILKEATSKSKSKK